MKIRRHVIRTFFVKNHSVLQTRATAALDVDAQVFSRIFRVRQHFFDLAGRAFGQAHSGRFSLRLSAHLRRESNSGKKSCQTTRRRFHAASWVSRTRRPAQMQVVPESLFKYLFCPVKRILQLLGVVLAVLWAPITSHCAWES